MQKNIFIIFKLDHKYSRLQDLKYRKALYQNVNFCKKNRLHYKQTVLISKLSDTPLNLVINTGLIIFTFYISTIILLVSPHCCLYPYMLVQQNLVWRLLNLARSEERR